MRCFTRTGSALCTGLVLLACMMIFLIGPLKAQVPQIDGDVEPIGKVFSEFDPVESGVGFLRRLRFSKPGTDYLRFNFDQISYSGSLPFTIVIIDANGRPREAVTSQKFTSSSKFTSKLIFGDVATIEVRAQQEPEGLDFVVASATYQRTAGVPASISGDDDRRSVLEFQDNPIIWSHALPVARLIFSRGGVPYTCTGFLVGTSQFLTNEHCVNSEELCATAVALFGYHSSLDDPEQYGCESVDSQSFQLDYALLTLEGSPGEIWGALEFESGAINAGDSLYIIQHPGGAPKQISIEGCTVVDSRTDGRGSNTDVSHSCDTLGGSSGSPILSTATHNVVALHHFGFQPGSQWSNVNRGVRIDLIHDQIR